MVIWLVSVEFCQSWHFMDAFPTLISNYLPVKVTIQNEADTESKQVIFLELMNDVLLAS